MTDKQVLHPTFGRSVKRGATDTCSKCGGTIPEEHVPVLLWDETDHNIMWALCGACDHVVLSMVTK